MDATGNYENREIRRVPMACTICRARKLKCRKAEKHAPSCERCIKDGQECIFVPVSEDTSHSQGHDRSLTGNVLPSWYHSGTHPPQQHPNATHVPQAAHWPAQSGGRVVDDPQPTQYYHSQPNAGTSQYSRHPPYWQQQTIGVAQPPAHCTPYTGTDTWSAVQPAQPAAYDQFVQSSNNPPSAVPSSSAENYSTAYLPPYNQNHAMYTAQWAGPPHVHQTYPELNMVYENPSGYDASGDYESPNHTPHDSTSESNE